MCGNCRTAKHPRHPTGVFSCSVKCFSAQLYTVHIEVLARVIQSVTTTLERINETANQLQYLYRLPRLRRMQRRDSFRILRNELNTLWQLHRKEMAMMNARQPLVIERPVDSISHEELAGYTPSTRRNKFIEAFDDVLREVLIEMRADSVECHLQPLEQVHASRGKTLVWRIDSRKPVLINRGETSHT
jgi:hypothetical protein